MINRSKRKPKRRQKKSELEKKVESEYKHYLRKICLDLGTGVTKSNQLHNKGRELFGDLFRGVFAYNTIPPLISGQCLIFNLDTLGKPGSHWCAMYKSGRSTYYYDSFGRQVIKGLGYFESDPDIDQGMKESNCGQRCLAWLVCVYLLGLDKALLI